MEKIYRLEFSPISSIGPFKKSVFRIYVFHILRINHLQNTCLGYYYDLHTCFGFPGWGDCDVLLRDPPDVSIPISYTNVDL